MCHKSKNSELQMDISTLKENIRGDSLPTIYPLGMAKKKWTHFNKIDLLISKRHLWHVAFSKEMSTATFKNLPTKQEDISSKY